MGDGVSVAPASFLKDCDGKGKTPDRTGVDSGCVGHGRSPLQVFPKILSDRRSHLRLRTGGRTGGAPVATQLPRLFPLAGPVNRQAEAVGLACSGRT
jgi:hypothetical protein